MMQARFMAGGGKGKLLFSTYLEINIDNAEILFINKSDFFLTQRPLCTVCLMHLISVFTLIYNMSEFERNKNMKKYIIDMYE